MIGAVLFFGFAVMVFLLIIDQWLPPVKVYGDKPQPINDPSARKPKDGRGPMVPVTLSLHFHRSFRTHYTDPAKLEADVLAAVRQALREALGPGGGQESCLVRIER